MGCESSVERRNPLGREAYVEGRRPEKVQSSGTVTSSSSVSFLVGVVYTTALRPSLYHAQRLPSFFSAASNW